MMFQAPPNPHHNTKRTWEGKLHVDIDRGLFLDEQNRDIMLRGINAGGRSKWAPFLPFEIDPHAETDEVYARAYTYFERARTWGLNVARIPFSWEGLEPERGLYDARFLARINALIDAAYHNDIRTILDFHQDLYAAPLGGDGFPVWTLHERAQARKPWNTRGWFVSYALDDDVLHAFDRFWDNADGIRDAFHEMWQIMLGRFGTHPGVIGVDMINEPGWGTATDLPRWKKQVLVPFYENLIEDLRPLAPGVIFFYGEPGVEFNGLGHGGLHLNTSGIAYAPHLYDPALLVFPKGGMTAPPQKPIEALGAFRRQSGVPVLLGEFGYTHGAPEGPRWLTMALDAMDQQRISATLWEYSETAQKWNEEDLNVLGPNNEEREILDVYARPYMRAICGDFQHFEFDHHDASCTAQWRATDTGWTEIAIPSRGNLHIQHFEHYGPVLEAEHAPEYGALMVRAEPGANIEFQFDLVST